MQTQVEVYQYGSSFRSFKFIVGSSFLHVILLALAIVASIFIPQTEIPAVTEITILDSAPEVQAVSLQAAPTVAEPVIQAQKTAAATPAAAEPEPAATAHSEAPVVEKDAVVVPAPKIAKAHALPKAAATAAHKMVAPAVTPAHVQAPVADTVVDSEVEAPVLDSTDLDQALKSEVAVPNAKPLDDKDIADDLDKVDNEQSAKIQALKKTMDQESAGALSEQEESLKAAQAETNEQADALAQQAAAIKAADHARIQKALQSEQQAAAEAKAAADKIARDQAAAEFAAAQKAAVEKAAAARYAQEVAYGHSLGVDAPVKALGDIRQAPGNKPPAYDSDDRLSGRQGEVSFLAYISGDGKVTQMKLLKSTGHRSLDAKTLAAIRAWKFYPGQTGWVEVPFKWDLKGGPQEMSSTLRRSVSQNQK